MKSIKLKMIFPDIKPDDYDKYKIHFARKATNGVEPLDEYIADPTHLEWWKEWNTYSTGKNHFNKPYIFSLIRDYHENDTWLFGGVWKVVGIDRRSRTNPYKIELVRRFEPFVGRLRITYPYSKRATRVNMKDHFEKMVVKEILDEPYFEPFPGYSEVDEPFYVLRTIIEKRDKKWKDALSVNGIYLITDTKTCKKYVGKADGRNGLWQRWSEYISNGHGGDEALKELISRKGYKYAENYFRFAILEVFTYEDCRTISDRESHWKDVLMTRNERIGYNRN